MDTIKNMTPLQWLIILMSFNSAVVGATAQLTDLFGPSVAHTIVSAVTFANTLLGAFMVPFGGQSAMVKNVLAMPGVEHLSVNAQASPTLASIAVDPTITKIAATPETKAQVSQIAKGAAVLLVAFILSTLVLPGPAMAQRKPAIPAPAFDPLKPIKDLNSAIEQKNADIAAANPAGPNDPNVSCDFHIFVGLTPKNLESAIKKCLSDANSTIVDDTARALDSAQNYKPNPDQDAINCLGPGLAILKAGVQVPAVAEVKDANGNVTTPGQAAKNPGLILLFQKYREFVLAGGLTSCKTWVDTAVNATVVQATNNVIGGVAALGGAALLAPK